MILILKLIAGLILGASVFILTGYNKSDIQSIKEYITRKENFIATLLNLVTGLIIIFSWIDNENSLAIIGITEITFFTAGILGFTAHSLWQSIIDGTSRDVKTKVGANRK